MRRVLRLVLALEDLRGLGGNAGRAPGPSRRSRPTRAQLRGVRVIRLHCLPPYVRPTRRAGRETRRPKTARLPDPPRNCGASIPKVQVDRMPGSYAGTQPRAWTRLGSRFRFCRCVNGASESELLKYKQHRCKKSTKIPPLRADLHKGSENGQPRGSTAAAAGSKGTRGRSGKRLPAGLHEPPPPARPPVAFSANPAPRPAARISPPAGSRSAKRFARYSRIGRVLLYLLADAAHVHGNADGPRALVLLAPDALDQILAREHLAGMVGHQREYVGTPSAA